jgi:hypothetical protein
MFVLFILVRAIEPQADRPGELSRLAFAGSRSAISFFKRGIVNPLGGFYDLDDERRANGAQLRPSR